MIVSIWRCDYRNFCLHNVAVHNLRDEPARYCIDFGFPTTNNVFPETNKLPCSRKDTNVTNGDRDPRHKHSHTQTHLKKTHGQVANPQVLGNSVHKTVWKENEEANSLLQAWLLFLLRTERFLHTYIIIIYHRISLANASLGIPDDILWSCDILYKASYASRVPQASSHVRRVSFHTSKRHSI